MNTLSQEASNKSQPQADLAKQSQNPVAKLISVPIQNNINFNIGPFNRTQNQTLLQPVLPFSITENWNLISRTIIPFNYQPDVASNNGGEYGLGDINTTVFLSPGKPGKLIWGLGPTLQFDTATDKTLGTGKWALGPSLVLLTMPGNWVVGTLISNIWSFAGDSDREDVNLFSLQYFINYNFKKGWYLTSSPINTANWEADSDNTWTIPIGGGGGRVFHLGNQPLNFSTQAFYNAEKPSGGPDWSLRFQLTFLFPKK
ncbi:MAG: neuromedin U [Thermodesulfobacteriales bacterium]|nr:MAG: neuromedin U [Thermodesulfobacteriales bacterium]